MHHKSQAIHPVIWVWLLPNHLDGYGKKILIHYQWQVPAGPLAHRHGQLCPGIKWASQKSWRYWKQFKTARLRSPVACPWNASGWPELCWGSGHLWNGGFFNMLSWGAWRYGKTGGIMLVSCDSKKSSPSLGALLADLFEFGPRLIEKVSGPKSVCLACIVW